MHFATVCAEDPIDSVDDAKSLASPALSLYAAYAEADTAVGVANAATGNCQRYLSRLESDRDDIDVTVYQHRTSVKWYAILIKVGCYVEIGCCATTSLDEEDNGILITVTIIISKRTVPAGGTGIDFTNNISTTTKFSLDDGLSQVFTDVEQGNYTVTEADEAGYQLVGLTCNDAASTRLSRGDIATRTATIAVETGETVICTFSNSVDDFILVQSEMYPAGATGFNFNVGGATTGAFTLDGGDFELLEVVSGTTTITQALPDFPYYIDEKYCEVDVIYTFRNGQPGTITLVKDATPADDTEFELIFFHGTSMQYSYLQDPSFPGDDYGKLPPGQYLFTETLQTGADQRSQNTHSNWTSSWGQIKSRKREISNA